MKRLITLLVILFSATVAHAQESYCMIDPSIGTTSGTYGTIPYGYAPIYFVAGDEIRFIYLQGAPTSIAVQIGGVQIATINEGKSATYAIPSNGEYTITFTATPEGIAKIETLCLGYDLYTGTSSIDYPTKEADGDNWQYGAASVAIVFIDYDDDGNPSIDLYDLATESYINGFVTADMVQTLMDTPPLENTLILTFGSISVYVLTTGELQFNMIDGEGKEYVFILPSLDGEGAYGYIIEPSS